GERPRLNPIVRWTRRWGMHGSSESAAEDPTELTVSRKLLETLHVSVPERAMLPCGRERFSLLVEAVRTALSDPPWFPKNRRPDQRFTGAIIESRSDGSYWVHEQHEASILHHSATRSWPVALIEEAVRQYISHTCGESIDGIAIDWRG